ncbi:MAG TPA: hypothetical protein VK024_07970, partial [Actinomycetaceae bacterium]|nr:hypothetical protein [Actinomycetaceae bacterium]
EPGAAGYPHAAPVASEATAAPPTQPLASPYDTGELPASPPGAAAHYEVPTASYGAATATHGAPQGYAPEGGYRQPDGGYQPDAGYHQEGYGGSQASAEAVPPPRSRALAHVLSVVLTLLGAPLAMLCLAAVQSRLAAQHQELLVAGGRYTLGVLAAFIGALVLVVGLAILARWSSLGAFVTGILMFGFGLAVLVAPALQTMGWLLSVRDALNNVGDLLLGDAMLVSLGSGQFALLGLVLLLAGYVSHSARRAGRRQERSAAYHAA